MGAWVLAVVLLAATYALTLASADPVDLLTGLVLAAVLMLALRGRLPAPGERNPPSLLVRVVAFPVLLGALLVDMTKGTWDVSLRVLHLRPLQSPGIVVVPVGDRSPRGVAVTGLLIGLSPGTVLLDVDEQRRVMLFHVIDASDPDAVRAQIDGFYDRYQQRVFP
jgi:multisubunit Na+/H+ antiporter MnhE subunit